MTILINSNSTFNLNKIYQSILMGVTMALIMYSMAGYQNNSTAIIILIILTLAIVFSIRNQVGITDNQFLKSMIEHHQMAVDMSKRKLEKQTDPDVATLCNNIISSQNQEINFMKSK